MNLTLLCAFLLRDAGACTCRPKVLTTVDACRSSARVYAGTVGEYSWPERLDLLRTETDFASVRLEVETIWRGESAPNFVFGTGKSMCDVSPAPGTRFVVCDDATAGTPPAMSQCRQPAFGIAAREIEAQLGQGREPRGPPAPSWSGTRRRTALRASVLGAAVAVALAGFAIGRVASGPTRPTGASSFSRWGLVLGTFVAVAAIGRIAANAASTSGLHGIMAQLASTLAVLFVACMAIGRWPSAFGGGRRGLVGAGGLWALSMAVGFGRAHFPLQWAGSVECSKGRLEEVLRKGPWDIDSETGRGLLKDATGKSCVDWGLVPFEVFTVFSPTPCLAFPDGSGGKWVGCSRGKVDDVEYFYGWEGL